MTLVSVGAMMKIALQASDDLAKENIEAEVIDCRTLVPLDTKTIIESVNKTGRLVVVEEARDRCSAASHIATVVSDEALSSLKAPIKRIIVPNICMPYAPNVEKTLNDSEMFKKGEALYEIESEKVTMEVEAPHDGGCVGSIPATLYACTRTLLKTNYTNFRIIYSLLYSVAYY